MLSAQPEPGSAQLSLRCLVGSQMTSVGTTEVSIIP